MVLTLLACTPASAVTETSNRLVVHVISGRTQAVTNSFTISFDGSGGISSVALYRPSGRILSVPEIREDSTTSMELFSTITVSTVDSATEIIRDGPDSQEALVLTIRPIGTSEFAMEVPGRSELSIVLRMSADGSTADYSVDSRVVNRFQFTEDVIRVEYPTLLRSYRYSDGVLSGLTTVGKASGTEWSGSVSVDGPETEIIEPALGDPVPFSVKIQAFGRGESQDSLTSIVNFYVLMFTLPGGLTDFVFPLVATPTRFITSRTE